MSTFNLNKLILLIFTGSNGGSCSTTKLQYRVNTQVHFKVYMKHVTVSIILFNKGIQ